MTTRPPCRLRFSHEVTTGISHGREPVVSKKVGRKVPKGRQAYELACLTVVPSGLSVRRLATHGFASVCSSRRWAIRVTNSRLKCIRHGSLGIHFQPMLLLVQNLHGVAAVFRAIRAIMHGLSGGAWVITFWRIQLFVGCVCCRFRKPGLSISTPCRATWTGKREPANNHRHCDSANGKNQCQGEHQLQKLAASLITL